MKLDPLVADTVPRSDDITPYDEMHFVTYLRLLDASAAGAGWREVARIILRRDSASDPERTRRCWDAHLARAQWMTTRGYRNLLEEAANTVTREDQSPH
jgi:hypothetical protein